MNLKKIDSIKIIEWIATAVSLIGLILNAQQIIWCWPVWCISNILWIYYTYKTKQFAQLLLWAAYTVVNVWAYFEWTKLI